MQEQEHGVKHLRRHKHHLLVFREQQPPLAGENLSNKKWKTKYKDCSLVITKQEAHSPYLRVRSDNNLQTNISQGKIFLWVQKK